MLQQRLLYQSIYIYNVMKNTFIENKYMDIEVDKNTFIEKKTTYTCIRAGDP